MAVPEPEPNATRREAAIRVLLVVLGVALPLALCEAIGAVLLHWDDARYEAVMPDEVRRVTNREDRHIPTTPDPYLGFRIAPDIARERVQTNEYGLRAGAISERPPPDVLRILLLGGSVAWGYTSNSNDDTVARYLEEALTHRASGVSALRNRRIEVLNAGAPAYVAWQGALAYAIHLRALGAQWVFSLDGTNDITSAIENGVAGAPKRYRLVREAYRTPDPDPLGELGAWLLHRTRDTKIARALSRLRPKPVAAFGAPPPEQIARQLAEATRFLADAADRDAARVVEILQPMVILPDTKPLTDFERQIGVEYEHRMPGRNAYFAASYAAMRAELARLDRAQDPAYHWIDATRAFADVSEPTYTDECHLTPLGRRHLAESIADAWIAMIDSGSATPEKEST